MNAAVNLLFFLFYTYVNIYLKGYQGKGFYYNFSTKINLTHLSVMCMPTLNRNARFITIGLFRFALWGPLNPKAHPEFPTLKC